MEVQDATHICSLVLASLFTITVVIFYARRNVFPLKGRDSKTMTLVALLMIVVYINYYLPGSYPCISRLWVFVYAENGIFLCYLFRIWNLLFRFEITDNLVLIHRLKRENASTEAIQRAEGWYLRHRHYIQPNFLVKIAIVDYFLSTIYLVASTLFEETGWCPNQDTGSRSIAYITWSITIWLRILVGLILGWQLKSKTSDGYWVKTELKVVCINTILWAAAGFLIERFEHADQVQGSHIGFWASMGFSLGILFAGFWIPILATWTIDLGPLPSLNPPSLNAQPIPRELKDILRIQEGYDSFFRFLTKEFAAESLSFLRDLGDWIERASKLRKRKLSIVLASPVQPPAPTTPTSRTFRNHFRNSIEKKQQQTESNIQEIQWSETQLCEQIRDIWKQYLKPGAPFEVNLSSHMRQCVKSEMDHWTTYLGLSYSPSTTSKSRNLPTTSLSTSSSSSTPEQPIVTITSTQSPGSHSESFHPLPDLLKAASIAHKEIFKLVQDDSFRRYLASSLYAQFQEEYQLKYQGVVIDRDQIQFYQPSSELFLLDASQQKLPSSHSMSSASPPGSPRDSETESSIIFHTRQKSSGLSPKSAPIKEETESSEVQLKTQTLPTPSPRNGKSISPQIGSVLMEPTGTSISTEKGPLVEMETNETEKVS